jgi:acyl dehydratase
MRTFSSRGDGDLNIHTDEATAIASGMPAAVAQGLMTYAVAYELLVRKFGPAVIGKGTELELAFTQPVLEGNSITVNAEVTDVRRAVSGAARLEISIWCENQDGSQVAVGSAAVYLSPL